MKVPDKKVPGKKTGKRDGDNFKKAFPQDPILKENEKQENKTSKENDDKEIILFYKAPIFKYPKYDFY